MSGHRLSPNHTTRTPAAHVFVDTEAWVRTVGSGPVHEQHSFRLGCATYVRLEGGRPTRRQKLDFDRTDNFWVWLHGFLDKRRPTWLWAHNMVYDWTLLGGWDVLERSQLTCPNPCLVDPPTILRCTSPFGRLVALDSLNWWRCPLADLGRSVGLPKLEMPDHIGTDAEWFEYCRRDVEILERAVLRLCSWVRDNDLGVLQTTAPAQAMSAWRHRWPESLPCIHDDERAYRLERASYVGGRREVFHLGPAPGPVHVLDTNSLLPSVMADRPYPSLLLGFREADDPKHLGGLLDSLDCVATVRIHSDDQVYPTRLNDHVVHARGDYWTTLTTPDLLRAMGNGHVVSTGAYAWYERADLFSGYVRFFWGLRLQARVAGDPVSEGLCKLLLNALHGKLGQRSKSWVADPEAPVLKDWGRWLGWTGDPQGIVEYRGVAGAAQRAGPDGRAPNTFCAIPAHVTAWGRVRMDGFRAACPPHSIYYQGEDSLHVSGAGLKALRAAGVVRDHELGYLRHETSAESACYLGRCNYTLGDEPKISGIPRSAEPLPGGAWRVRQWQRAGSVVASRPNGTIGVQAVDVAAPVDAYLGVVREDGWVDPYYLTLESER